MAMISLRQLLDHAAENGYGLPAFNVNNLEQIQAIMQAARCLRQPGDPAGLGRRPEVRRRALPAPDGRGRGVEMYPHIPVVPPPGSRCLARSCASSDPLRLHERDDGRLARADMKTPASYDYNVDVTRRVVRDGACDRRVGRRRTGLPRLARDGHGRQGGRRRCRGRRSTHAQLLTDPAQAADFVERTGVDALAIAIGTSHGAYKFSASPRATSSRSTASSTSTRSSRTRTS
jgi:fructose-bisphosphate aldolase class II